MLSYSGSKNIFAAVCLTLIYTSTFSPLKANAPVDATPSSSYIAASNTYVSYKVYHPYVWQGLFAAATDPQGMPNGFDHHYDNLNHSYDSQGVNRKFYEQRSFTYAH